MINTLSFTGPMLARYIDLNAIKCATVWRIEKHRWEVLEGSIDGGFQAAIFRTKREAVILQRAINAAIKGANHAQN